MPGEITATAADIAENKSPQNFATHRDNIPANYDALYKELIDHVKESLDTFRGRDLPPHIKEVLLRSNLQTKDNLELLLNQARDKLKTFANTREIPSSWLFLLTTVRIILVLKNHEPLTTLDEALVVSGPQISTKQRSLIDQLFAQNKTSFDEETPDYPILDFTKPEISLSPPKTLRECRETDIDLLVYFQNEIDKTSPEPILFPGLASDWPACSKWKDLNYLIKTTNNGQRLVPIEVGSSYTSNTWTQELIDFRKFVDEYLLNDSNNHRTGYMAQYNLLDHITALKNDIYVPDICYVDTTKHEYARPTVVALYYNAWIGPKNTISPLHKDAYFNVFCQVVGYKKVRLYPPGTKNIYERPTKENGVDMSNTSLVDIEKGINDAEYRSKFPDFPWESDYFECILGPGDCLFIPKDWWHHIESQTTSMSISLWF